MQGKQDKLSLALLFPLTRLRKEAMFLHILTRPGSDRPFQPERIYPSHFYALLIGSTTSKMVV